MNRNLLSIAGMALGVAMLIFYFDMNEPGEDRDFSFLPFVAIAVIVVSMRRRWFFGWSKKRRRKQ